MNNPFLTPECDSKQRLQSGSKHLLQLRSDSKYLLRSDSKQRLQSDSKHLLQLWSDSKHLLRSDSKHFLRIDSKHFLRSDSKQRPRVTPNTFSSSRVTPSLRVYKREYHSVVISFVISRHGVRNSSYTKNVFLRSMWVKIYTQI